MTDRLFYFYSFQSDGMFYFYSFQSDGIFHLKQVEAPKTFSSLVLSRFYYCNALLRVSLIKFKE